MDQATHVAIFGGSELLLVQLYRTYHLDRISSWCDRAGYFTKRLAYHLLLRGGLQLHALGGSNRVCYLFLIREGSSNKLERLLFKALMPQLSIPAEMAGNTQMAKPSFA